MSRFIPTGILVLAEALASKDKALAAFKSSEAVRMGYVHEAKDLHKRIVSRGWHIEEDASACTPAPPTKQNMKNPRQPLDALPHSA